MAEKIEFRSKLWWWAFLSGLGFRKISDKATSETEKVKYVVDQKKRDICRIENEKQAIKREEKRQRLAEWRKNKKKTHYVDINVNPQKSKKRWYHGYDVVNKISSDNNDEEIKKYKYEK